MLKFMDLDLYPLMKILPKAIVSMVEVQRLLILPETASQKNSKATGNSICNKIVTEVIRYGKTK